MIILAWVYYSGLIVFWGAELTCVYAGEYGSRIAPRIATPLARMSSMTEG